MVLTSTSTPQGKKSKVDNQEESVYSTKTVMTMHQASKYTLLDGDATEVNVVKGASAAENVDEEEKDLVFRRERAELLYLDASFEDMQLVHDSYVLQDSRAMSFLNLALVQGDVTEDQLKYLRLKFNLLSDAYRTSKAHVRELCEKIHAAHDTMKEHKSLEGVFNTLPDTIAKTKRVSHADDKQAKEHLVNVSELRVQLLTFRNKLEAFEEQYEKDDNMVRYLLEEKGKLESELNRLDKQDHKKHAIDDIRNLDLDILTTQRQLEEVMKNCAMAERSVQLERDKNTMKLEIIDSLEHNLIKVTTKRTQLQEFLKESIQEIELNRSKVVQADKEVRDLSEQLLVATAQLTRCKTHHDAVKSARKEEEAVVEQTRRELEQVERKVVTLRAQAAENSETSNQLADSMRLEDVLWRQAEERAASTLSDKKKRVTMLRIAQHKLEQAEEQRVALAMRLKTVRTLLETDPNLNYGLYEQRRKMSEEIEKLNTKLLKSKGSAYANITKQVVFLQSKMWGARKHLHGLTQTHARANSEWVKNLTSRGQIATHLAQLRNEQKILSWRHSALARILTSQELRAENLKQRFDHEMSECNRNYRQLVLEQQKIVEWKERLKVVKMEISNLLQLSGQRVRQLQRARARLLVECAAREALRIELLAQNNKLREYRLEEEALHMLVKRAEWRLALCRQYGAMMREEFNACVNERNTTALLLCDRTEEVARFTEKIKAFEDMFMRADNECMDRVEVVKGLRTVMTCEQNDVYLLQRGTQECGGLVGTVDVLSVEVTCVTTKEVYSHRMVGDGPRAELHDQLRDKYFSLERRLKEKEMRLVELKLLQDQVNRILATLQQRVPTRLEDAQSTAHTKVKVQTKVIDTSRQMKTLICEVALASSTSRGLKHQLDARRAELEEARRRMGRGEAPTENAMKEWDTMKRLQTCAPRTTYSETCMPSPSPRPTAYIPNVQGRKVLHLPRPYGAYAPFKPFRPTPHLRHYRAPGEARAGTRSERPH